MKYLLLLSSMALAVAGQIFLKRGERITFSVSKVG